MMRQAKSETAEESEDRGEMWDYSALAKLAVQGFERRRRWLNMGSACTRLVVRGSGLIQ